MRLNYALHGVEQVLSVCLSVFSVSHEWKLTLHKPQRIKYPMTDLVCQDDGMGSTQSNDHQLKISWTFQNFPAFFWSGASRKKNYFGTAPARKKRKRMKISSFPLLTPKELPSKFSFSGANTREEKERERGNKSFHFSPQQGLRAANQPPQTRDESNLDSIRAKMKSCSARRKSGKKEKKKESKSRLSKAINYP